MKITYDKEAKAIYIQLRNREIVSTKVVVDGFHIDLDKNRKIVGVELLSIIPTFHIFKNRKKTSIKKA